MPHRLTLQRCAAALVVAFCAGAAQADPLAANPDSTLDAAWAPLDQPLDLSLPLLSPASPAGAAPATNPDIMKKFTATPPVTNGWEGKAGVDYAAPDSRLRPEFMLPGASPDKSSGVAWMNVTAPGLGLPLSWDKASIETRIDPMQDQGKLGTTFSRSIPVGGLFSVTVQNSYSMTRSLASTPPIAVAAPAIPAAKSATAATASEHSQVFGTDQAVRLNILPTGTAFSVGAARSSTDEKWLRSLSAEQKLFGGPVSVTTSVNETATGDLSKSVKAGFKRMW